MENRNELQENNIKNCMCYYFDDIITNRDIYSVDIFIQFITFYTKLELVENHCIRFDKIDGFIRVLDGEIKHLVLFDYGLFDKIFDRIKYLISEKSGITDSINLSFRKIRIYSYNLLSIQKIFSFLNVIILIKSVVNK